MSASSLSTARVTRRTLVGSSLAGAALAPIGSASLTTALAATQATPAGDQETGAAAPTLDWRMWLLASADELRPEAPGAASQAEIDEVVDAQANVTDEQTAAIRRWSGGGYVTFPWTSLAFELFTEFGIGGMAQGRFMGVYQTALHDAEIAAWDAQIAHARPGPAATDERIVPATGVNADQPSFPSAHAAVAAAAAGVLAYLIPDAEAGRFDALATAAAESRIAAGAAFRSDVDAGLALGQAVAERALARAKADGSDAVWDPATRPTGPGTWQPTPPGFVETPAAPLAGSWKTWVLESGDQFRPLPPPEYGSAAWQAELVAVQEVARNLTFEQRQLALWWAAGSPWGFGNSWGQELARRAGMTSPQASQALADMYVAMADAIISIWDAKYTWWTSRPVTEDPELVPVLPSPPYPAYPSGYSGAIGSATAVLGHYFPEAADDLGERAWEAAASRCWAGIHYPIDDDVGLIMGRQVGRLVSALESAGGGA